MLIYLPTGRGELRPSTHFSHFLAVVKGTISRGLLRDCKTLRNIREGSFGALEEGEPPT